MFNKEETIWNKAGENQISLFCVFLALNVLQLELSDKDEKILSRITKTVCRAKNKRMKVPLQVPQRFLNFAGTYPKEGLTRPIKGTTDTTTTLLADITDVTEENKTDSTRDMANFHVPASTQIPTQH